MARVSVIIPVHNGAATLAEAIDSALGQTFADLEVIVVDDGSTDATPDVLGRYGARITVVNRPDPQARRGSSAARNAGAKAATGELLAFLDADDTWRQGMVARTVAALDAHPDCVLAYCNLGIVDSEGRALGANIIGPAFDHPPALDEMLRHPWPIMPSAVVVRRSVFDAVGGFVEELGTSFDDIYFCLVARERGPFHYIAEPLGTWRFSVFPRRLKRRPLHYREREALGRLVRERFGVAADGLLRSRMRSSRSILGYLGLRAMHEGNRALARRAFVEALVADPLRLKTYFRLVRTFLPDRLARALSGRTRSIGA